MSNKQPFINILLSTTSGIDGKVIGATNLFTVPAGKKCLVDKAVLRLTAAVAIGTPPAQAGIGVALGEEDIFSRSTLNGMTTTNNIYVFQTSGSRYYANGGDVIKFGIDTGFNGVTATLTVDLYGSII